MKEFYEGDLGLKTRNGEVWTLEIAITVEAENADEAASLIVNMRDEHKHYVRDFHECTPVALRVERDITADEYAALFPETQLSESDLASIQDETIIAESKIR